jgi:signal transduction histidine kinase/ligand-binding sensor domain-containing protein
LKQSSFSEFRISFTVLFLLFIAACRNKIVDIPLPSDKTGFSQPIAKAIHFTAAKKINWPKGANPIKPIIRKLDISKLAAKLFDSTESLPFSQPPEEVPFSMSKLSDTVFNYDGLPAKRFQFESSILGQPKLIKTDHPHLVSTGSGLIYELGGPLAGAHVTCLFIDKMNFLWIATQDGLYRYDGENLELFIPGSVAHTIWTIVEDHDNRLWMGTASNGINILDVKTGVLKHLSIAQGLRSNVINRMLLDSAGRIWVTEFGPGGVALGVDVLDQDSMIVKHIGWDEGLTTNAATGIAQDNQNNIWIGNMGGGVNIIDLKNRRIKYLETHSGLNTNDVTAVKVDKLNRIWIAGNNGEMNLIDVQRGTIKHFYKDQGLKTNMIWSLQDDNIGGMMLGTFGNNSSGNGVEIIDPSGGMLKTISTASGISTYNVEKIVEDDLGQIWVATTAGLNMFKRDGNNFEHIGGSSIISSLLEDSSGLIWICTLQDGVEILDRVTGLIKTLTTLQGLGSNEVTNIVGKDDKIYIVNTEGLDIINSTRDTLRHLAKAQGLTYRATDQILVDMQGRIWLGSGSYGFGLDLLDMRKGTMQHLGTDRGLISFPISDIKQDRQGMIWVAFNNGALGVIDPVNGTIKYLETTKELQFTSTKILLSDTDDNIWIGTSQGIYIINANRDSLINLSTREGLINDDINSLDQYSGKVYAGTSAGLSIITPASYSSQKIWQVTSYGTDQGIRKLVKTYASNFITNKGQFLWGDQGLTILNDLNKIKAAPSVYITGMDLFNEPQYFTGKPWLHVSEGDTLWSPAKDTFYLNGKLPSGNVHSHLKNTRWKDVAGPYNMPVYLDLPYDNNYLQFHFAMAHLGSQDTTEYRYIMEGIDKNWSESTNTFSQNYLNLSPGDYIFKVSSKSSNGQWATPAAFSFTIMPPWWATWWAWAIYAILFITGLWLFIHFRSLSLKQKNQVLEERVVQRTLALNQSMEDLKATQAQLVQSEKMASLGELTAGIAHEIQNPLNFVNNFSEVNRELIDEASTANEASNQNEVKALLSALKANEEKISHHGKRADSIVKGMLQHSRASIGQKEQTDINALADEYFRLSYHGLRAKDKLFNSTMQTDFDPTIGRINIIPQDIGRVLMNLYNNAFYTVTVKKKQQPVGYEPNVSVSTRRIGDRAEIRVKDNGAGVSQKVIDKIFQPFFTTKPAGQGTGLGLSLSYDIIKAHGGELKVDSREGDGAEFIVQLPLG